MKNKIENELVSLNDGDKLYDEFFIKELEQRLETDPLVVGGLLNLFENQVDGDEEGVLTRGCDKTVSCTTCYGACECNALI